MMDRQDRRAARAAFTERKVDAGIFALRFREAVWVGASQTLGAAENRARFALGQGLARDPALAAAWAAGGGFGFEVLERFDPEIGAMTRGRLLKERAAEWRAHLGARDLGPAL